MSASALALHLDCSRTYIGKLEAEGVILRQGDGFPLDQSRVAYLRYLRRERRQSPRAEADAEHATAKAEMLHIQIAEKRHVLVKRDKANELIDQIAGTVLTHLSGMAARYERSVRLSVESIGSDADAVEVTLAIEPAHLFRCEVVREDQERTD